MHARQLARDLLRVFGISGLEHRASRIAAVFCLSVCLALAALCYANGIGDFYLFDSSVWLERNATLDLDAFSFPKLYEATMSGLATGPLGRPISMLSFALESWFAGGMVPQVSKSVNVTLHLLNGVLLFLVIRRCSAAFVVTHQQATTPAPAVVAVLVAGLWLLHPLHVSTVLYAVQRMAILSATFMLFGMLVYVSARVGQLHASARDGFRLSVLSSVVAFTLLAASAKETGMLLPVFIALIEVFVFKGHVAGVARRSVMIVSHGVLLLVPVILVLIYVFSPQFVAAGYQAREFDMTERILTQARLLWSYVSWTYFPNIRGMALYHDDIAPSISLINPISTLVAVVSWVVAIGVALRVRRIFPLITLGVLWFLYGHALESTVFALELSFEHRNYLASTGPLLLLAVGLVRLGASAGRLRWVPAGIVLTGFAFLLGVRAQFWSDELQLASYHLATHPESIRARHHFANTNLRLGEKEADPYRARKYIVTAREGYVSLLQADPADLLAAVTLLYMDRRWFPDLGSHEEWRDRIVRAMSKPVWSPTDYNALGVLIECINKRVCAADASFAMRAISDLVESGRRDNASLNLYLSRYFLGVGNDPRRALDYSVSAIRIAPSSFPAYAEAVEAYVRMGMHGRAAEVLGDWVVRDTAASRIATVIGLVD